MFSRSFRLLPILFGVILMCGCASMLNKGNNSMVIGSDPAGAAVYVNGNQKGITPFTYSYTPDDGETVSIELRHSGYDAATLSVRPGMSGSVLFADAMLLGIPYLADRNNPSLYRLPVNEYNVHLYKETDPALAHYALPITGVSIELGDRPDLGTFHGRRITLKDAVFRELNYSDPLSGSIQMGLKGSWIDSRSVRLGTTKGDETVRRAKIYLHPRITSIKADLKGKESNCSGKVDLRIDWRFMSGVRKDSLLFSVDQNVQYLVNGARSGEVLSDAIAHAARLMAENDSLHPKVAAAYGIGLEMAKGENVILGLPSPIKFDGRKDMLSALVKAVVTIQTSDGHGSGFLISNDGFLITNEHVVEGERSVKVKFEQGFTLDGTVKKTNKDFDLALIKVEATDLPALSIGDDQALMLGEEIFAIGTPLDASLGQSVSRGILSGRREFENFQSCRPM